MYFLQHDMYWIYDKLGNAVNHKLTLKFIHNNYDLSLVRPKKEERKTMTDKEKEYLLREVVDALIKLDSHLMTSRDKAEFLLYIEDLINNKQEPVLDKIKTEIITKDRNVKAARRDGCCFFTTDEILSILDKYAVEQE